MVSIYFCHVSVVLYSMIFQKCIGSDMFAWIRHDAAEVCALPSALVVYEWNHVSIEREICRACADIFGGSC